MSAAPSPTMEPPLAGVRVLDLTRLLPGPMCTLYLAELGADVIKIEDTGAGDYARTLGAPGEVALFFRAINRGKRSVSIDLKCEAGREALLALVQRADVIVEGFRPGVMASLGLAYDALTMANPRIVCASISGYGQDGPRAHAAGHDINYLGYAGVLDQTGTRGGAPALCNLQIADLLGGAAMPAIAILGALYGAQRTGRGRVIDVGMSEAVLAHAVFMLQAHGDTGRTAPRGEDMLTGGVPAYGVYVTQDSRFVAVGALEEKFWRLLCATLGRPDLVPFGLARGEDGERTRAALATIFASAPLAHWEARFAQVDCCVSPVATLAEALADPHVRARGLVRHGSDGTPFFAPPFRVSGCEAVLERDAPRQGEHSVEVLREAGYSDETISRLQSQGVIRTA